MAIDLDDEIVQDFVVEGGEILELLGEQLVSLEQSPEDIELLNAIFRGFHTIKGGAGFLAIEPLVQICHQAEDIFNILRQGDRQVTSELMDVFLRVLDLVNEMFEQIRSGQDPEPVDPGLLEALNAYKNPLAETSLQAKAGISKADVVEQEFESLLLTAGEDFTESNVVPQTTDDEITEKEFDDLLKVLDEVGESSISKSAEDQSTAEKATPADEITEEEFEDLLDELHGKGKFLTHSVTEHVSVGKAVEQNVAVSADEISEDEFEELLDNLHGQGKFGSISPQIEQKDNNQPSKHHSQEQSSLAAPADQSQPPAKQSKTSAASDVKKGTGKKASKPAASQHEATVRVDTQVLDYIMNMVGELVLVRNRFQTLRTTADDEQFSKAVANLDVVTADLQLAVMKTRMQPIKKVFGRFPRVVRDLARSLKKEIRLETQGEETDLDKNLVEALADPLIHLVRNAVDHGIETPEVREAVGKPREGVIVLTASQEGDHIEMTIQDNGKGMNADALRKTAVEKGLMDQESASRLDDKECFNLIFAPGFSTKTEISDVSGRGVGMDVVKTRIAQMNGTVEVYSVEGKGSIITIKVPLTLAIMPTLMVKLNGQAFALPLASVLEILDLDLGNTNVVDGQMCVVVRDKALPLFHLKDWLVNEAYGYAGNNKD